MTLDKHNICLYIKDEGHLEEMREFLIGKGESINTGWFKYYQGNSYHNYLQVGAFYKWILSNPVGLTEVTTEQFKKLWE